MRSANQFDEAMKKLDSYNALNKFNDPPEMRTSAFRLVQQSNHIAKSNSANSIRDKLRVLPPKYASSLDGDRDKLFTKHQTDSEIIQDDFDVLNEILEENKRISLNLMATSISKSNMESDKRRLSSFKDFVTQNSPSIPQQIETKYELPVAAPRIKKLSSSSVLTQLSQLKRLYEANDDSDDSYKADEEVKLYLGNLSANEEKSSELSGSWSRVKAKRNVYKQSFQLHKDEHNLLDDYKWSSKKGTPTLKVKTKLKQYLKQILKHLKNTNLYVHFLIVHPLIELRDSFCGFSKLILGKSLLQLLSRKMSERWIQIILI